MAHEMLVSATRLLFLQLDCCFRINGSGKEIKSDARSRSDVCARVHRTAVEVEDILYGKKTVQWEKRKNKQERKRKVISKEKKEMGRPCLGRPMRSPDYMTHSAYDYDLQTFTNFLS